jgi:hypothetical protein
MAPHADTLPDRCATCGAAYSIEDTDTDGAEFTEQHECANGHTGTVSGVEGDPVGEWDVSGRVFVAPPMAGEPDLTRAERDAKSLRMDANRSHVIHNDRGL